MPTCDGRSRMRGAGSVAAALLLIALLAGCGGGARRAGPPRVDPTVTEKEPPEVTSTQPYGPDERPATADAAETGDPPTSATKPPVVEAELIRLPGQSRVLPSEDPRNRPAGGGPAGRLPDHSSTHPSSASAARSDATMDTAPEAVAAKISAAPPRPGQPSYVVQVFATRTTTRAHALRDELEEALGIPVIVEDEDGIWKVRLGQEAERSAAEKLRRRLIAMGYEDAFIVRRRSR